MTVITELNLEASPQKEIQSSVLHFSPFSCIVFIVGKRHLSRRFMISHSFARMQLGGCCCGCITTHQNSQPSRHIRHTIRFSIFAIFSMACSAEWQSLFVVVNMRAYACKKSQHFSCQLTEYSLR